MPRVTNTEHINLYFTSIKNNNSEAKYKYLARCNVCKKRLDKYIYKSFLFIKLKYKYHGAKNECHLINLSLKKIQECL